VRLLIGAGGTGGGVYPALAVLQAMSGNPDVLWVGAQGGIESTLVQRAGIDFKEIPAAGIHGVGIKRVPRNLSLIVRGIIASRRIISSFRPDVILLTGGFIAFPVALAARGIPILLILPDIEPGLAIKAVSSFVSLIAVPTADSQKYFHNKKKVFVSGYPTRPEITRWDRESGSKEFNLVHTLPVVLIFGGSKGARSINQAVLKSIPELLKISQVIHISGELDWAAVEMSKEKLTTEEKARYHAYPYLYDQMGAALACADLVVSRSGASTLGEYPTHGLAAVLVPYPYAWRYQSVNAHYLANQDAALILEDSQLGEKLFSTIKQLLEDPARLNNMRVAMKNLSRPQAAQLIGQRLHSLAGERS
jgi:UDP-N-acetylglucosamine--N-acetylmuramyl-(pentapeptide) pyrophosphoryl-undecaprenol N-acetylglucosamine transferase